MIQRIVATMWMLSFGASALAVVDFGEHPFPFSEFRNSSAATSSCSAPVPSFWCGLQDATLTRVPTKGVDLFFSDGGEVVAAYAKPQKGQVLGSYNLDNRQNLIPWTSPFAGAALEVDGQVVSFSTSEASWEQRDEATWVGTFTARTDDLDVVRSVVVSNLSHTLEWSLTVTRRAGSDGDAGTVGLVFPGIAGVSNPVIKVGQGVGEAGTFATNPLSQPIPSPSYASLQNNDRNTAFAIVVRPQGADTGVVAVPLPPRAVAVRGAFDSGEGATASLALTSYLGPNELVRYQQEGYVELPGLFRPNILGRMSLGVLWVLRSIHDMVGNWGLSIILLTLAFRVLIWPLIQTQTKSMYGMQELQPRIQALQKKYKDDRETLTQETMKLYREAGVNPAGGCLPIFAQMPLFIILWRVFVNFEFSEGFLWVPDLGQADPYYVLPILYVAVMFGMSWFSARGNPQSLRQQILINVVFAFVLFGFPAGVLLYFVVSMGVQVLQYWLIQRGRDAPKPAGAKA